VVKKSARPASAKRTASVKKSSAKVVTKTVSSKAPKDVPIALQKSKKPPKANPKALKMESGFANDADNEEEKVKAE
tara:strand:- start:242 stop:469 length:228 start_codon:yes stop_codon:yes gene_type:complete